MSNYQRPGYKVHKNLNFFRRLCFALQGLRLSWIGEASFRSHIVIAVLTCAGLVAIRPAPVWWALLALAIGFVISAETFNSALERIADRVQPEFDEEIKAIKDIAAGAVLVAAFTALAIAAALAAELYL